MKKKIILISISILIIICSMVYAYVKSVNNDISFTEEGIKYAILVDGSKVKKLPTKGLYNVTVTCQNAIGTWDYVAWKLNISQITGDIICNLSFTTTPKTYLNEKVISLAGKKQGTGQVVEEKLSASPSNVEWTSLTEKQYGNMYESSAANSTSGTSMDSFTFDGNQWSSNIGNMTSGKFYHLSFTVPENGYYQLCYSIPSTSTSNVLYLYQGTVSKGSISASTSAVKTDCLDIGYTTANTTYRIVQKAFSNSSYSIPTMKFYVKQSAKRIDYRYEGKNPNNYVLFNNELWRIIGVFDKYTHGQPENLTKIVRVASLGALTWDKNNTSTWGSSSLKNLLNNYYYLQKDGTSSGSCYSNSTTLQSKCDYRINGINDEARKMIKNVSWYAGTSDNKDSTTVYNSERSGTTTTGYIGLMYASDYMFSVLESNCARNVNFHSYKSSSTCASYSWMVGQGSQWFITPYNTKSVFTMFYEYASGYFYQETNRGFHVLPTLYLDSSVYTYAGTGTMLDPYIIQMDEI